MSVGLNDYDFSEKEKWRTWAWNRIKEKANKPTKDLLGLYFAAAQDLDRPVAVKKGFSNHNLIAIERDNKSVQTLRKNGVNVIHSDLLSVLNDWKGKNEIDFINADFTCGITNDILAFLFSLYFCGAVSNGCVVVINLLRGRDNGLMDMADLCNIKNSKASFILKKVIPKKKRSNKHRGQRFLTCGIMWVGINLDNALGVSGKSFSPNTDNYFADINKQNGAIINFIKKTNPSFYSYKSSNGRHVMDSCALKINKENTQKNQMRIKENPLEIVFAGLDIQLKTQNVKMKVAAAKAIRTKSINMAQI